PLHRLMARGPTPRGTLALLAAARALAVLRGRRYVVPQDVYDIAPEVLRHRVTLTYDALAEGVHPEAVVESILQRVPAPRISPQQMPATEYATQPYAPVAPADPYAAAGGPGS